MLGSVSPLLRETATRHIPQVARTNVGIVDQNTVLVAMQIYSTLLVVFKDTIRYLSSLQLLPLPGRITIVQRLNTPTILPFYGRQATEMVRRILGMNYLKAPGGYWMALYPQAPGHVFRELPGAEQTILLSSAIVTLVSAMTVAYWVFRIIVSAITHLVLAPAQWALRKFVKNYIGRRPSVLQEVVGECAAIVLDNAPFHSSVNMLAWRVLGISGLVSQAHKILWRYNSKEETRSVSWGVIAEAVALGMFVYEGISFPDNLNIPRSILLTCDALGYSTTVIGLVGIWHVVEAAFMMSGVVLAVIGTCVLEVAKAWFGSKSRIVAFVEGVQDILGNAKDLAEDSHVHEQTSNTSIHNEVSQALSTPSNSSITLLPTITDTTSDHESSVATIPGHLNEVVEHTNNDTFVSANEETLTPTPVMESAQPNDQTTNDKNICNNGVIHAWRTNLDFDESKQVSMGIILTTNDTNTIKDDETSSTLSSEPFHYPGASESDGEKQPDPEIVEEIPGNNDVDSGNDYIQSEKAESALDASQSSIGNSTVLVEAQTPAVTEENVMVSVVEPEQSTSASAELDAEASLEHVKPVVAVREKAEPSSQPKALAPSLSKRETSARPVAEPESPISSAITPSIASVPQPVRAPSPATAEQNAEASSSTSSTIVEVRTRPKFPSRYDQLNKNHEFYTQRAREILSRPVNDVPIWWRPIQSLPSEFSYKGTKVKPGKGWKHRGKPIKPPKSLKDMAGCGEAVWNSFLVDYVDYLQEVLPDQLNIHDGNLNLALCERIIWEVDGFDYKQFPRGEHIRW